MKIEEVEQLKKQLKDEYEANEAAIERVLRLLSGNKPNGATAPSISKVTSSTVEKKVVEAISELPAQFKLSDVTDKLAVKYSGEEINRATVSSIIFRLKEENKLTLLVKGIGRRAALYGKPE